MRNDSRSSSPWPPWGHGYPPFVVVADTLDCSYEPGRGFSWCRRTTRLVVVGLEASLRRPASRDSYDPGKWLTYAAGIGLHKLNNAEADADVHHRHPHTVVSSPSGHEGLHNREPAARPSLWRRRLQMPKGA